MAFALEKVWAYRIGSKVIIFTDHAEDTKVENDEPIEAQTHARSKRTRQVPSRLADCELLHDSYFMKVSSFILSTS